MADEDFDRAQHRLRQEIAARDTDQPGWTIFPVDSMPDGELVMAKWTGDQPPEQADRDMMANYNRYVIAEAAHTTLPIDWFTVAAWAVAGLFSLAAWALIGRWLR